MRSRHSPLTANHTCAPATAPSQPIIHALPPPPPRLQVLVIGATNLASSLDEALLRPGRFDRSIYMGRPSQSNRLKVLQVGRAAGAGSGDSSRQGWAAGDSCKLAGKGSRSSAARACWTLAPD